MPGQPLGAFAITVRQAGQGFGVAAGGQRKRLNFRRTASAEPMSACDMQAAEAILAKLVARAYAADHPELFGPHLARMIGGPANEER
ncbi:MAG TPA: hypothetical protein VMX94_06675 [Armatimonadota bacterium]|nr:hypothetical protein [Armatimonadota bacterium]